MSIKIFDKNSSSRVLMILGAFAVLNALFLVLISNFNLGIVLVFLGGLVLFVYGRFFKTINQKCSSGVFKWLKYAVILALLFYAGTMVFLAGYGLNDNATHTEDAVIVLGAGIRGQRVSGALARRLDRAFEYSLENPGAVIVVSGGQGPQEEITEALAMERYLIGKGLAPQRIIKEDKSSSTYENLTFSKQILDQRFDRPYKVVVVTNHFHIYRAVQMAKAVGLETTHAGAELAWYSIPVTYMREGLAVYKLWVFGT